MTGLFQYVHEKATIGVRAKIDGVSFAFGNYFAHRYMVTKEYNVTGTETFTHGGSSAPVNEWKSINLKLYDINMAFSASDIQSYYLEPSFNNLSPQVQSGICSACLWELALELGTTKIDNLIIGSLQSMTQVDVPSQVHAAYQLYQEAISQNFDDDELCIMLNMLAKLF
ncbi:MAG: hypothetical protein ACI86M_002754 [Saprospiraceae bacterium]|jgi:hypothetical protein